MRPGVAQRQQRLRRGIGPVGHAPRLADQDRRRPGLTRKGHPQTGLTKPGEAAKPTSEVTVDPPKAVEVDASSGWLGTDPGSVGAPNRPGGGAKETASGGCIDSDALDSSPPFQGKTIPPVVTTPKLAAPSPLSCTGTGPGP